MAPHLHTEHSSYPSGRRRDVARIAMASLLLVFGLGIAATAAENDWSSYNRTLTSERFAPQKQINRANVARLRKICTYDTGAETGFQTGDSGWQ